MRILQNPKLTTPLLLLNFVVSIAFFLVFIFVLKDTPDDKATYLGLAEGILKGKYSYWHFLPVYVPDTLRNPGYSLFLAFVKLFTNSFEPAKYIQLGLYFLAIKMILDIISHYYKQIIVKNIFLILLLPSIYIVAYAPLVYPEILMAFLITLVFWIDIKIVAGKWIKYILLGLVYGLIFQIHLHRLQEK